MPGNDKTSFTDYPERKFPTAFQLGMFAAVVTFAGGYALAWWVGG